MLFRSVYGTLDMPAHGDPEAPIHQHVAPEYLADAVPQYGVPVRIGIANVVTNTLASYRGYDTLGEVAVIFTAAAGTFEWTLELSRPIREPFSVEIEGSKTERTEERANGDDRDLLFVLGEMELR